MFNTDGCLYRQKSEKSDRKYRYIDIFTDNYNSKGNEDVILCGNAIHKL